MDQSGKIKLRKNLVENDGQYKGMAEALERVMPFDAEGIPKRLVLQLDFSQSKLFPLQVEIPKKQSFEGI